MKMALFLHLDHMTQLNLFLEIYRCFCKQNVYESSTHSHIAHTANCSSLSISNIEQTSKLMFTTAADVLSNNLPMSDWQKVADNISNHRIQMKSLLIF